jgi:TnpA family transposase
MFSSVVKNTRTPQYKIIFVGINWFYFCSSREKLLFLLLVLCSDKTPTQNIMVRKLSSYARKNRTKRALWEYDNIIKSLYFLNYINSPSLRRNVQKALYRSESYHKLNKAVSFAEFGKLRFEDENDQQIWRL